MGKTVLIIAPLIVGGFLLFAAFWMGRVFERVRSEHAASHINVDLHHGLVELVRRILSPAGLDDVVVLPDATRAEAAALLARADSNLVRVRKAERRRAGYR